MQVDFSHISTELRQSQLASFLIVGNKLTQLTRRKQHTDLRPSKSIRDAPKAWWKFAVEATLKHWLKRRREMTWEYLAKRRQTRKRYIALYIDVGSLLVN